MIVSELKESLGEAGQLGVHRSDLSLPLRLEQIPVGTKLLRVRKCSVVSHIRADHPFKDEDILALRIGIVMLSPEPVRLIRDFRQDQKRLDRLENFRRVENIQRTT